MALCDLRPCFGITSSGGAAALMSGSALNGLVTVMAVISSLQFFISSFLMSSSLGCQVAELWAFFRRFERCSQTAN